MRNMKISKQYVRGAYLESLVHLDVCPIGTIYQHFETRGLWGWERNGRSSFGFKTALRAVRELLKEMDDALAVA